MCNSSIHKQEPVTQGVVSDRYLSGVLRLMHASHQQPRVLWVGPFMCQPWLRLTAVPPTVTFQNRFATTERAYPACFCQPTRQVHSKAVAVAAASAIRLGRHFLRYPKVSSLLPPLLFHRLQRQGLGKRQPAVLLEAALPVITSLCPVARFVLPIFKLISHSL